MVLDRMRNLDDWVRFRVLGPVSVTDEGGLPFDLGGPKQLTVLAMLIARAARPVTADVIVEAVYGEKPHAAARRTVQTYVSNLRRQLGEVIVRERDGWSLAVDLATIDAARFEEMYGSAQELTSESPELAGGLLREALSLWRGYPYADVEAHGYLDGEITRLSELRTAAQAARIDVDLAMGRHLELIGELDALLVEHPYMERFRGQHMLALYRAGRQKEALRSYSTLRDLLVEELGVDPTVELQDMEQRILEHDASLLAPASTAVSRKAVLVADPGDPIELSHLGTVDRQERVTRADALLRRAAEDHGGGSPAQAGPAIYAFFDDAVNAVLAAQDVAGDDDTIRLAVDYGDVEESDEGVSGPPVLRAARLLASAHPGQVLLSPEAQTAVARSGRSGIRVEALGSFDLSGLDGPVVVHQLLVGDPPRIFPELVTDRLPPPQPPGGARPMPGYELHEPIGSGSLGVIYRAYQPSLGREVAVEVIGRSDSSDPDFIRRFETEAHRLSLLEHPHVLPVLDFWRDTTGAFIVYPFHRGGSLAEPAVAIDGEEVFGQVAAALSYAHTYGFVHGSLRPDQVALDEGGNAYLYGFAIVGVGEPSPDFAAYIPPEYFDGSAPTAAADIYAMGVLAHELLTGQRWRTDEARVTYEAGIEQATSENPALRQASVDQLVADLAVTEAEPPEARFTSTRNPYKGLAAFQETDADDFFGRTPAIEELVETLGTVRLVAVVGPSGIGKSSLVRAGLVPALRRDAVPGSENWVLTDMLPGSHPLHELERAVERVAVELPAHVRERLSDGDPDFFAQLDLVLPPNSDLLLVVDQFEELFTTTSEHTRDRFLGFLLAAARSERCRVVITLRADFLDRPLRLSEFGGVLRRGLVTLGAPSRAELNDAVAGPATNVGISIEEPLVERLVSDVQDRPGALPLLQYTLAELFHSRSSDVITLDSYERLGGVSGALASRAEYIFAQLDGPSRTVAKQVLMRLVAMSEVDAPTRRRVRVSELNHLRPDRVIDAFTRGRLLVTDLDPVTHTPTIEVAHEALFSHWPRLSGFIDELRGDVVMHRRLSEAVEEWVTNDRSTEYLLSPSRVEHHLEWSSDSELQLNDLERNFIEESQRWNERQRLRRGRRRAGVLTGLALGAAVAVWFGVAAQNNARDARVTELIAQSEAVLDDDPELSLLLGVEAAAEAGETTIPIRALLHRALGEHRKVFTYEWPEDREIVLFLETALSPDGSTLVATGTGSYIEGWDLERDQRLWSVDFPEGSIAMGPVFSRDGALVMIGVGQVLSQELAESELGLFILDADTGEVVEHRETGPCGAGIRPEGVDDDWTVVSFFTYTLEGGPGCNGLGGPFTSVIMDIATGERLAQRVTVIPNSHNAAISPDGTMAAWLTVGQGIEVVSLETSETLMTVFDEGRGPIWPPSFSADGRHLVYGRQALRIWEVPSGEVVTERPENEVPGAEYSAFHHQDELLVTTRTDGVVSIWDPATGTDYFTFATGELANSSSVHGTLVAVPNAQGPHVNIWEIGSLTAEVANVEACPPRFAQPAASVIQGSLDISGPVGSVVVYCPGDQAPATVLFEPDSGEVVRRIEGTWGRSPGLPWGQGPALSTDGTRAVLQQTMRDPLLGGDVFVYDFESEVAVELEDFCESLLPAHGNCEQLVLEASAFSPDGRYVALVGGVLGVEEPVSAWAAWETASGTRVDSDSSNDSPSPPWPSSAIFSPDGSRLYVANNIFAPGVIDGGEVLQIYDTSTWSLLIETSPDGLQVESQLGPFTTNGEHLLGIGASGVAILDADTGAAVQHMPGTFTVADLSPDQQLMVTGTRDGLIEVWDFNAFRERGAGVLVERIPAGSFLGEGQGQNVRFLGSDKLWITPQDGRVQLYTLDPDALLSIARDRITRSFTHEECEIYAIDPCPTLDR